MTKKLWGGRFEKPTDPLVEGFTKSIQYDYKLARYDVAGSLLHVRILNRAGILSSDETGALSAPLVELLKIFKSGSLPASAFEDIHSYIQNFVEEKAGDVALKLHTARSRNDQVVFATKAYCKNQLKQVAHSARELKQAFAELILKYKDVIIPGFTHLQHAQPVLLEDYLNVYVSMLTRDENKLDSVNKSIVLSLGAGALAGTPISTEHYAEKSSEIIQQLEETLSHDLVLEATTNSLDVVSDRDFVIETVSALSIIAMHLSRFAEDIILWATREFGFVTLDDAFCTGSSLMPQKKNPDVLELIRGYAGRIYGNLVSVLTMMKGLPLTYNRDMQLDKEPLFNSFEIVQAELKVLSGLVKTLKFDTARIAEHLKDESLYATDLVYYLVGKKVPFKEAHTIIGELVRYSLENDIEIKAMPQDVLNNFSDKLIKSEIVLRFDPVDSVKSKKSIKRVEQGA